LLIRRTERYTDPERLQSLHRPLRILRSRRRLQSPATDCGDGGSGGGGDIEYSHFTDSEVSDTLQTLGRGIGRMHCERMKTFSVLFGENTAAERQIDGALEALNASAAECEAQIAAYFEDLRQCLDRKRRESLDALHTVHRQKEEALRAKRRTLRRHRKRIVEQNRRCDALLSTARPTTAEREIKKLEKMSRRSDSTLKDVDVLDFESRTVVHFEQRHRDAFLAAVCTVDRCQRPKAPTLKVSATTATSVTLWVAAMTTAERRRIHRARGNNEARNRWIHRIEIECIHCDFDCPCHSGRRVQRIDIDQEAELQRSHQTTIEGLAPGLYALRARCSNISGWGAFCEAVEVQLTANRNNRPPIERGRGRTKRQLL